MAEPTRIEEEKAIRNSIGKRKSARDAAAGSSKCTNSYGPGGSREKRKMEREAIGQARRCHFVLQEKGGDRTTTSWVL